MIKLKIFLLLLGSIGAIVTSTQSTQAQSISPELKATLEAADLKYKITGEDEVKIDIKFKPRGWKNSISGLLDLNAIEQFGNLKTRGLVIGLYLPGERLPTNIPLENLLQAPHTHYCNGSAIRLERNGTSQWLFRHDVNDDHIRRDPKQLRHIVENTLQCADMLKTQIEQYKE